MKRSLRHGFGLCATVLLAAAAARAAGPLADRADPLVIGGSMLPAEMLGGDKTSYRVFADHGAGAEVVPFQIEERDEKGTILVEKGKDSSKLDGKFDRRDELVVMAQDAGAGKPSAPEGCGEGTVVSVKETESGTAGYFLVARCESPPALSDKDYVSYDPARLTAGSDLYKMGWQKGRIFSYDYLSVAGGKDYLDRLKVRAKVGKFGIAYTFMEDQFNHDYIGYTDGPVRVTVKLDNYWSLGPLGKLPLAQYYYFYKETVFQRAAMDINMNPTLLGFIINVEIGHDMEVPREGARVCTNVTPECLPVDAPAEKIGKLSERPMKWGGIDVPGGDATMRLVPDPRLKTKVQGLFIYDAELEAPPEYSKGSLPLISFNLVDWDDVAPDVYNLDFHYYFMEQYSEDAFKRLDKIIEQPLSVSFGP